jgi:hypothetical protein
MESFNNNQKVLTMNNKLMWIGVTLVAMGLVLPRATYRATFGGNFIGSGTLLGYQYVQSLLAFCCKPSK